MALFEAAMLLQVLNHARGRRAVRSSLAAEWSEMSERHRQGDERKLARTRWLHANGAEASFPCGVVEVEGTPIPAIVAVVPDGLAFLAEIPVDATVNDVLEVGRIAAGSITDVDVVDADGNHVPEPMRESFEPDVDLSLVLRWSRDGTSEEDRFAFRSTWSAWQAARRLRNAQQG
jgi:hypothetical protein